VGQPTVINNVETWRTSRSSLPGRRNGSRSIGRKKSQSTKGFALTGNINNSGLIEVPMAPLARDLFDIAAAS
jgi:NADH:ubiquinone oxidoreductase subunit F (NADH-binding)